MKRAASTAASAAVTEKPSVEAKARTRRKVPTLSAGQVAFHAGVTANRERFTLKASAERYKKQAGQK